MKSKNPDYIPMPGELIADAEARAEYMKTHDDPRHEYCATFNCMGKQMTEKVWAFDIKQAEENIKSQWSLVGAQLTNFDIRAL